MKGAIDDRRFHRSWVNGPQLPEFCSLARCRSAAFGESAPLYFLSVLHGAPRYRWAEGRHIYGEQVFCVTYSPPSSRGHSLYCMAYGLGHCRWRRAITERLHATQTTADGDARLDWPAMACNAQG
jgi:hypothetical protein